MFVKRFLKIFNKKLDGFSILEVSVVMIIAGLFFSYILRSKHLINEANIESTINRISSYQIAVKMFVNNYKRLPGCKDPENFDATQFWNELQEQGSVQVPQKNFALPIGCIVRIEKDPTDFSPGIWMILENINKTPFFQREQALKIDSKIDDGLPSTGDIIAKGEDGKVYDYENGNGLCSLYIKLN